MNKKIQNNEKGFTMIELIVVVALMAIIGAVLVPMFSQMSVKARLTSDISSIKTFQRQIDMYRTERNDFPGNMTSGPSAIVDESVGQDLVTHKYIDPKDLVATTGGYTLKLQTGGVLMASGGTCYLEVGASTPYVDIINGWDGKEGNKGWAEVK